MSDRFPDLPAHMSGLKTDHRGFPVPWFVAWVDGEPQFPVVEGEKIGKACHEGRCWVCGGFLGRYRASVIGPMCAINRTISEPQSHSECARFSARNCPFMANPRMGRVPESKLPAERKDAAGGGIKRNPGAVCVWIETKRTTMFKAQGGVLFRLGDPDQVEWYANGREATREEVLHSIDTGLPLLLEACERERTESDRLFAKQELERRRLGVLELLPA